MADIQDTTNWRVIHLFNDDFILVTEIRASVLNEKFVILTNPIKIMTSQEEDGVAIALLKWNQYTSDSSITISSNHIMSITSMTEETILYYSSAMKKEKENLSQDKKDKEEKDKEYKDLLNSLDEEETEQSKSTKKVHRKRTKTGETIQ